MGDQVGQLLYGVEITQERYSQLRGVEKELGWGKDAKPNPEWSEDTDADWENGGLRKSLSKKFPQIQIEQPYETEDFYISIKESSKNSFNGGRKLSKTIETKPEWDEMLNYFAQEIDMHFYPEQATWYLIGHYN